MSGKIYQRVKEWAAAVGGPITECTVEIAGVPVRFTGTPTEPCQAHLPPGDHRHLLEGRFHETVGEELYKAKRIHGWAEKRRAP